MTPNCQGRNTFGSTRCIDKWNDTELSDAINSMFRWYRNAAKCYVYLQDVSRSALDVKRKFQPATPGTGFSEEQVVHLRMDPPRAYCSNVS
jgi:hypothetical protein